MKKLLIIFAVGFVTISCSQNEEEVKKQSLDDVYFYLYNYYIVQNTNQINLISFKNMNKGYYELRYKIKNNDSLWIIHYYNEDDFLYNFIYQQSNSINKITDSINIERRERNDFPLHKRWDWIGTVPKAR